MTSKGEKKSCQCVEGWYIDKTGTRRKAPPVHDCAYISLRNSKIPAAERREGQETADLKGTIGHSFEWCRRFNAAMTDLMAAT